jgi:tRNA modification GTPase
VSQRYLQDAHVVLACGDSDMAVCAAVEAVAAHTTAPVLAVRTKSDLASTNVALGDMSVIDMSVVDMSVPVVTVSAETGEGLDTLLHAIDQRVSSASPASDDDARITRERHRLGISTALDEVRAFRQAWGAAFVPAPIAASHLLTARDALSELLGTVDTEEILGRVFRDFCIGK